MVMTGSLAGRDELPRKSEEMIYLRRVVNAARRRLGIKFVVDRPADYRRSILLAGTARSGTTWASEIINYRNEYRYIFEPFYAKKVPLARPFGLRKYLRPDDQAPDLLRAARTIMAGQVRSTWTERFNYRVVSNRRLIKCIRANLMLKWLHANFPGMPMVLILRHPCAVALSYAKHNFRDVVDALLEQPALMADFLAPHEEALRRCDSAFERAVYTWCIETLVPLKQFRPGEIHVLFYETLVSDPEREIGRMFAFLGKQYDPLILGRVARPSLTARKDSAIINGEDPLDSWQTQLDGALQQRAFEIVREFGLDAIYTDELLPRPDGLSTLMAGAAV